MSACAIGFLVGGFEDKGYAASLCDPDQAFSSRQDHFPALDYTWTGNQDERTVPADPYVTYLDYQEILFKNDPMRFID